MAFCHGQIRVAYLYTIGAYIGWMVTSCALPRGDKYGCPTGTPVCSSDMETLGSGQIQLYPLDIFPTNIDKCTVHTSDGLLHMEFRTKGQHTRRSTTC